MSVDFSNISPVNSSTITPCFCCHISKTSFYIILNSKILAISVITLIFSFFLLYKGTYIFLPLLLLLVSLCHLLISCVSFFKYFKHKSMCTRFHKWQAIGNILFALVMIIFFSCSVFFMFYLTIQSNIKDPQIWNDLIFKYTCMIVLFPVVTFYSYWSMIFMRIVSEKREKYMMNSTSIPNIDFYSVTRTANESKG